jgi:hypothetical protein
MEGNDQSWPLVVTEEFFHPFFLFSAGRQRAAEGEF